MLLLNFGHKRQLHQSDCLVACADMALNHIGVHLRYERLAKLLKAGPSFTPFSNLRYLESFGLSVTLRKGGNTTTFQHAIDIGLPIIVGVRTWTWQHWAGETTDHAVVVVGIAPEQGLIYINDPFFAQAPIEMSLNEFEIGWIERDQEYAIIALAPP